MSQIGFYRVLLWLPMLVPILLAPLWLVPGFSDSASTGLPLYILTFGALAVAVPYIVLALWTDRWLRATPSPEPAMVWTRAALLPLQLIPLYVLSQLGGEVVGRVRGSEASTAFEIISSILLGVGWVVVMGYAYVGFACVLTRFAMWVGCVRAPTHASAT